MASNIKILHKLINIKNRSKITHTQKITNINNNTCNKAVYFESVLSFFADMSILPGIYIYIPPPHPRPLGGDKTHSARVIWPGNPALGSHSNMAALQAVAALSRRRGNSAPQWCGNSAPWWCGNSASRRHWFPPVSAEPRIGCQFWPQSGSDLPKMRQIKLSRPHYTTFWLAESYYQKLI